MATGLDASPAAKVAYREPIGLDWCKTNVTKPLAIRLRSALRVLGGLTALALTAGSLPSCARSEGVAPVLTVAPTTQVISPGNCPVTVPARPYVARAPYLPQPPDYYHSVWYGNDSLWTMLDPAGASFRDKTFWWSRNFDIAAEREPLIIVTGTRLDAPGSFSAGNPGTHAYADFGTAMLVGVPTPARGCWEIRAYYKGAELAYVIDY